MSAIVTATAIAATGEATLSQDDFLDRNFLKGRSFILGFGDSEHHGVVVVVVGGGHFCLFCNVFSCTVYLRRCM